MLRRFEGKIAKRLKDGKVQMKARFGHDRPVSLDDVLSITQALPSVLYHGTFSDSADQIDRTGLSSMQRFNLYLSGIGDYQLLCSHHSAEFPMFNGLLRTAGVVRRDLRSGFVLILELVQNWGLPPKYRGFNMFKLNSSS